MKWDHDFCTTSQLLYVNENVGWEFDDGVQLQSDLI
jgi:hypothetical protein